MQNCSVVFTNVAVTYLERIEEEERLSRHQILAHGGAPCMRVWYGD